MTISGLIRLFLAVFGPNLDFSVKRINAFILTVELFDQVCQESQ